MEVAWTVRFLLLVGGCLSLPPPPEPICPERCDCQHQQHLLCTNRGLRVVPKTSALPSPQEVLTYSLGGNFIANITAFDFHRLAQLRRLDLQFNQIRSLHPKTFEKLSRLEELYLGNNLLEGLAPGTLAPLVKLRILYVNGNEIGRLSRGSFEGLESLVKLRLDGNSLGSLPDSAFAPLGNLLYLHLEANRIRFLGKNAFAHLGKLRFLNLSGNELQPSLRHPATFGPLRSLSTLILSANNLQQLGGRVFQHLPRLGLLSLSGNQLAHLAPEAFVGLSALRELRLEGNRLRELPAALLDPLGSLETLDLSRNELSALHPAAFRHLSRLRELNLRDNELGSLSGDIFTSSPALYRLDLDGNGWKCDCRLRGLKRWMGHWHSQGRLLTVFVQCRHPPALRGKYLDYLDDMQLQNGSCLDPATSSSPASVLPPVSTAAGAGEEQGAPPLGGLGKPQPQQQLQQQQQQRWRAHPGVAWDEGAGAHSSNQSGLRLSRRGPGLQHPSPSSATMFQLSPPVDLLEKPERTSPNWEDNGPSPSTPSFQRDAPSSSAPSPASDSWQRAEMQRLAAKHQERPAPSVAQEMLPPLVSDPCDFNKYILCNLTVEAVGTDTATVRWAVREHRSPRPLDGARFRLLFDRFGQQPKFHRFVYLPERSDTATLRELRGDTPYLVCVEAVLGGRVCPVAPRDHCAGLVTLPEAGQVAARAGGVDYQLLTLVLLAVNALLVFLALAAWASRWLRRKLRGRRKGGAPVHVRQMYSTRRPLRSMGTGVSADFSGFQSHRPRTAVCALSEADLIEFPCDRFMDSGGGSGGSRRDDHLMQRFAD